MAGTILAGGAVGLKDLVLDPDLIPLELGLSVGDEPVGGFTGRSWLIRLVDDRVREVAAGRLGGYVLVEAEAGMGKSALAAYLAFSPVRRWPAHFSRQSRVPETARANLIAQVVYRNTPPGELDPDAGLPGNYLDPVWFGKRLKQVQEQRHARGETGPLVVLVDGLDEAPAPAAGEVAFGLPVVLPPGVVVVATTRPGHSLPPRSRVARIDVTGVANLDDLREHLVATTRRDSVLADRLAAAGVSAEAFGQALLTASGGVWIYAVSVLDQVRDGSLPVDDLRTLPSGLAGYYSDNLRRLKAADPLWWEAVGLPVLGTLAAVTEPLTGSTIAAWSGGSPVGQVQDFLDGAARPFLAHTPSTRGGDGLGWYRLRHQSLRDFLSGRTAEHDDHTVVQASARCGQATRLAHARVYAAVLPPVDDAGVRDWAAAGTYARAHLTEHAAVTGELERLALDPGFLLWASVPQLLRAKRAVSSPDARLAFAARELTGHLDTVDDWQQVQMLHAWALKRRSTALATACRDRLRDDVAHAHKAVWRGTAHTPLHGHTNWVNAAATWTRPDGTTVLATAGYDQVVRLWDPDTLQPAGELHGHTSWVRAATTWTRPDGTTVLATAGTDKVVRLWDPDTLQPAGELHGHTNTVNAATAWTRPDGVTVLATAGADQVVRLWDPDTLQPAGELHGHTHPVRAATTWTRPDGVTLLATAGDDQSVMTWIPGPYPLILDT